MPKSSAKKKKQKNLDFYKPKLKVGAKKKRPDNYTDTSFRSHAIVLPNQSAINAVHRDTTEPVNRKNQTLADILAQFRHYNAAARRDAIAATKDFFQLHPQLVVPSLGALSTSIVKLIVDEDETVRRTLLSLLSYILPQTPPQAMAPFLPIFVTYTVSAMSHIQEGIRLHATQFLALWIEVAPAAVIAHSDRILPNFLCMLGLDSSDAIGGDSLPGQAGFTSSGGGKGKLMSFKVRIELLSGVYNFLNAWTAYKVAGGARYLPCGSHSPSPDPRTKDARNPSTMQWYFQPFFVSQLPVPPAVAFPVLDLDQLPITEISHGDQPMPECAQTSTLLEPSYSHLALFSSTVFESNPTTRCATQPGDQKAVNTLQPDSRMLMSNLYPILLSTWLDAAPLAFIEQGKGSMDALKSCAVVLKLLGLLWRSWLVVCGQRNFTGAVLGDGAMVEDRKWLDAHFKKVLKHFMVYFPFGHHGRGVYDAKTESVFQEMNAVFCEVVALFLLALGPAAEPDDLDSATALPKLAKLVVDYLLDVLGFESNGNPMVQDVHPDKLAMFLPAIWLLMNATKADRRADIFEAVLHHYQACQRQSASKRVLLDFIFKVFTVQYHRLYMGPLRQQQPCAAPPLLDSFRRFALFISQTVCELRPGQRFTALAFLRALQTHADFGDVPELNRENT